MPMPVDVRITYKDGSTEMHNIPLSLMFGHKNTENSTEPFMVEPEWSWTNPDYTLTVKGKSAIKKIEIDPSHRMADVDVGNNIWEK